MKRILCLITALAMCAFMFSACSKDDVEKLGEFVVPDSVSVTAKDGFDNSGFTMHVCEVSGFYEFISTSPEGSEIAWSVYLLDEEFSDAARYIPHAYTPVLEGNGMLYIDSGRFIYTHCSNNAMSEDTVTEGAVYTYSYIDSSSIKYTISSADSYENSGFTFWKCDTDGTYRVNTTNGAQAVSWSIFVLDSEFEDADRYIPQAYHDELADDNMFEAKAGQYIYVHCSANDFTEDSPVPGSTLFIRAVN